MKLSNRKRSAMLTVIVENRGCSYKEARAILSDLSESDQQELHDEVSTRKPESVYTIKSKLEEVGKICRGIGITSNLTMNGDKVPILQIDTQFFDSISIVYFSKVGEFQIFINDKYYLTEKSSNSICDQLDHIVD